MDEFCARLLEMVRGDLEFFESLVGKGCMCSMCHGAQDVTVGLSIAKHGLVEGKYTSVKTGFSIAIAGLEKMLDGQGNSKKAESMWEWRANYMTFMANVSYVVEQQEKAERAMQSGLFARRDFTVN